MYMIKLCYKRLIDISLSVVAFFAMSSCQGSIPGDDNPFPGGSGRPGDMKQVYFKASMDDYSVKSLLAPNEDETIFHTVWEADDRIFIQYTRDGVMGSSSSEEWNEENGFAVMLPDAGPANWTYSALSPVPNEFGEYSFSSDWTDDPLMSPCCREILCSDTVEVAGAEPGKDAQGKDISLHMRRLTTAIYFHVTSEELTGNKVKSVSITAKGTQPLWAKSIVTEADENGNVFLKPSENSTTYNTVTLNYVSKKPDIGDFTVLFNVLPFEFEKLALVVNLTDNRSFTIEYNGSGIYEAGEIYIFRKEITTAGNAIIKSFLQVSHEPFSFSDIIISGDGNANEGYGEDVDIAAETKCIFGPELSGNFPIRFQAGDSVSVFDGINSAIFRAKSTADVTELYNGEIRQSLQHLMLYPADEEAFASMGMIYTTIPSVQKAVPGGFDKHALVSTAHSSSGDIVFRNATAMLRFSTTGHWTKMVLTAINDEPIAGGVYVSAVSDEGSIRKVEGGFPSITLLNETDEVGESFYHVCIRPLTFDNQSGFTVEFFDGDFPLETRKYNFGKMSLNRSEIVDIGKFVFSNGWRPGEVAMRILDSGNYLFFADFNCGAYSVNDPGKLFTREEALAFLEGAGNGWRLPTAEELEHLWVNVGNKYTWHWSSDENFRGWTVHYGYEEHFICLPVPNDPVYYWTSDMYTDEYNLLHAKIVKYSSAQTPGKGSPESSWINYFPGVTSAKHYVRAVREVEPEN